MNTSQRGGTFEGVRELKFGGYCIELSDPVQPASDPSKVKALPGQL